MRRLEKRLAALEIGSTSERVFSTTVYPGETEEQAIKKQHPNGIPDSGNVVHFMTIYESKPNVG
jgi:hypothetical protein